MADLPPNQSSDLTWLLSRLVETVPHTRSALLLSSDGMPKYFHGLTADDADRLAALASSLCSLAQRVGSSFGGGDGIRQVNAELDDVILLVTAAGAGTVLAVLADRDVNAGVLSYEMGQLSKKVPTYLATPARHDIAAPGSGSGRA
ncbi:roadblock/LC7 domain-containing protein [Haloactinomyces albus]|uniref:Regulator of Ras-like GTPase activity (Roadblock/LC7/MglB family) n=1 Tax=Haloactinomyces albus TaxID=1352928 RepID=A0AAE4CP45_9ACTN|nr:roadblock/LC7 domain-containing protein [Haloactinomyces albus]MDR7304061.1 putative regulator of Ras-like GTPase activity (Roadblock/LC7/MglB family) [Haloactinomyces albus]